MVLKLVLTSLLLSSPAIAKNLPWNDVVSSIVWLKIAPEFQVEPISIGRDEVSFYVFSDLYTVTRQKDYFLIQRGQELSRVQTLTIEKALIFVKAKRRDDAFLTRDAFHQSIHPVEPPIGYFNSKFLYQCRSDLPVKFKIDGLPVDQLLKHTWLQNGSAESFGMPFTDEGTYFGGRSHIRTPDSFIERKPKHLDCSPVWIPENEVDEEKFSKNAACIARTLSLPQDTVFEGGVIDQAWSVNLDYHVLDRNCLKATRFMLECAGAKAPQVVNAGIGGKFEWDEMVSISVVKADHRDAIRKLRLELEDLRQNQNISNLDSEAVQLLDQALKVDSGIRGEEVGTSIPKTLREVCDLAHATCDHDLSRSINF